ncbi:MAG: hypothetical protein O3A95_09430 [Planctomycetota bacterium]|nr:hypothetical protein [Planctomycetota bacterium]
MTASNGMNSPNPQGRRKGRWAFPEIERLRRMYGFKSEVQIAQDLNRTVQSVRRMIGKVFEGDPVIGPWTALEIRKLKSYLGAADFTVIARIMRRPAAEIERKVQQLKGEVRQRAWTSADLQILKRYYGTRATKDVSLILGRPVNRIEDKAKELCLAKDKGYQRRAGSGDPVKMPRWGPAEVEELKRLYLEQDNLTIADHLNRTVKSVVSKAHDLGLRKSSSRLKDMGRQNVRARYDKSPNDEREMEA